MQLFEVGRPTLNMGITFPWKSDKRRSEQKAKPSLPPYLDGEFTYSVAAAAFFTDHPIWTEDQSWLSSHPLGFRLRLMRHPVSWIEKLPCSPPLWYEGGHCWTTQTTVSQADESSFNICPPHQSCSLQHPDVFSF